MLCSGHTLFLLTLLGSNRRAPRRDRGMSAFLVLSLSVLAGNWRQHICKLFWETPHAQLPDVGHLVPLCISHSSQVRPRVVHPLFLDAMVSSPRDSPLHIVTAKRLKTGYPPTPSSSPPGKSASLPRHVAGEGWLPCCCTWLKPVPPLHPALSPHSPPEEDLESHELVSAFTDTQLGNEISSLLFGRRPILDEGFSWNSSHLALGRWKHTPQTGREFPSIRNTAIPSRPTTPKPLE